MIGGGVDPGARLRLCADCVTTSDEVIGGIHSELPCQRCGAIPCVGAIVALPPGPARQRRGSAEARQGDEP